MATSWRPLSAVKARLDAEPAENKRFPKVTAWKVLDQLLTVARLKELTRVKIVKRGRSSGLRFDTSELADTFYGRQVMEGLGFGKRRHELALQPTATAGTRAAARSSIVLYPAMLTEQAARASGQFRHVGTEALDDRQPERFERSGDGRRTEPTRQVGHLRLVAVGQVLEVGVHGREERVAQADQQLLGEDPPPASRTCR